ncbi:MAG: preprotein translocase subunit SecG, partial [Verrucomicrobiota bacterium]
MFLTILINFLLAINIIVCVLMILLVLMQRPKSEGLGAAFGGGMTENLFGAQTTTVLTNITRWLGGIFFALTLILSILYSQQSKRTVKSDNLQELMKQAKPVTAPAVPAASAAASASPAVAAPAVSASPA